jgi:hypothetical protein
VCKLIHIVVLSAQEDISQVMDIARFHDTVALMAHGVVKMMHAKVIINDC